MSDISQGLPGDRQAGRSLSGGLELLDVLPLPAWVQDEGTLRILAVNERALQLYGHCRQDFLALTINDLEAPPDPADVAPARSQNHRKADGTLIALRLEASPIDVGGTPARLVIAVDVTASVATELALSRSERRSKQLLDSMADYEWAHDGQFRVTYLSENYEQVFGVPPAEVMGKRLSEGAGFTIDPAMSQYIMSAYARRKPFRDFTYSRRAPNGSVRWFKLSGTPTYDETGAFTGYRGGGAEITRQVEAEAAVRLGQQRLQEALAYVSQPIVVYDAEDRIVAYNQIFLELHRLPARHDGPAGSSASIAEVAQRRGISPSLPDAAELQERVGLLMDEPGGYPTVVQKGFFYRETAEWELSHHFYADGPDDPAIDLDTLLARYRSEAEHSYHLRDGRWMMVVYRALPGNGRLGLWTDVTALKRAEAERLTLEMQLHHSQRLEALGTLAGGIAHEINNALTPTIALGTMMIKGLPAGNRQRRNLEMAVQGAERSRDLVKQILTFSRKGQVPSRSIIDVATVLRQALALLRATLPTTIDLEEEIAPSPEIPGDPQQLGQVIVNIVTNAAEAIGAAPGSIRVSLKADEDQAQLRLSVADTGSGMNSTIAARVFEPFFTTKPPGEGTGLGLSVAHGIVEAHGGHITVESSPGAGSRFDVILPLRPAPAISPAGGL